MNIIIGGSEYIADKLQERAVYITTSSKSGDEMVFLDLKHPEAFDFSQLNDDSKIIFLAAVSSPDMCSNDYDNAYKINVTGTEFFIKHAIKRGAKVLFFSSDVVYGNTVKPVTEDSPTNPSGKYAEMKDHVEKTFKNEPNFKVFRLSYVLSQEDKYISYLRACMINNKIAEVFHPFTRKVVFIKDVLDAIEHILIKWDDFDNQKFNICGAEDIPRKDIADFFNEINENKLRYSLVTPDDCFWEARPKDINTHSLYLRSLIGHVPTKIKDPIHLIKNNE